MKLKKACNAKKWLFATATTALATASAFAQESSNPIDLESASNAATQMGTALKELLTGPVLTAVLAVVGGGLALWAIFKVVKWVRKGF